MSDNRGLTQKWFKCLNLCIKWWAIIADWLENNYNVHISVQKVGDYKGLTQKRCKYLYTRRWMLAIIGDWLENDYNGYIIEKWHRLVDVLEKMGLD